MPFTTPPTFVSGDVLTAAQLNILGDDLNYLNGIANGLTFSAVRVTRSATTSIGTGVWNDVSFTAEDYDYGSWWTSGTNIVVPAGAIPSGYTTIALLCQGRTIFTANSTGYRGLRILKNGSAEMTFTSASFATDNSHVAGSGFMIVAAGDVITMERYQNTGSPLDTSSAQLDVARFMPVA